MSEITQVGEASERVPSLFISLFQGITKGDVVVPNKYGYIATCIGTDKIYCGELSCYPTTDILLLLAKCLGNDKELLSAMELIASERGSIEIRDETLHFEDYCIVFGVPIPQAKIVCLEPE